MVIKKPLISPTAVTMTAIFHDIIDHVQHNFPNSVQAERNIYEFVFSVAQVAKSTSTQGMFRQLENRPDKKLTTKQNNYNTKIYYNTKTSITKPLKLQRYKFGQSLMHS